MLKYSELKYEDLYVGTYLIGYENQGESCVFLLYSTKPAYCVHYSIVIDCYAEEGKNKTLDILKEKLNEHKLDMLVWTHPHQDHYVGLTDIIKQYCDKNTKILIPSIANDCSGYNQEIQEIIKYINSLVHNRKASDMYDVQSISNDCETLYDDHLKNIPEVEGIRFKVISPFSRLAYCNADMKTVNYNRMSIGLLIQIYTAKDSLYYLYTGDMDEMTIKTLKYKVEIGEKVLPEHYEYIKIPHHGSLASRDLVEFFSEERRSRMAATTVFRLQNLPSEDVMNQYRNRVERLVRTDEVENNIIADDYVIVSARKVG